MYAFDSDNLSWTKNKIYDSTDNTKNILYNKKKNNIINYFMLLLFKLYIFLICFTIVTQSMKKLTGNNINETIDILFNNIKHIEFKYPIFNKNNNCELQFKILKSNFKELKRINYALNKELKYEKKLKLKYFNLFKIKESNEQFEIAQNNFDNDWKEYKSIYNKNSGKGKKVKKAFRNLIKKYHPDKFHPKFKNKATEWSIKINKLKPRKNN